MQIHWRRSLIVIGVLTCATPLRLAEAQGLSESTGVDQYFTNCATCHESDRAARRRPGRRCSSR